MKKVFTLLLAAMMIFVCASCDNKAQAPATTTENTEENSEKSRDDVVIEYDIAADPVATAEPIPIDERFVGTWIGVCGEGENHDIDYAEEFVLTVYSDGKVELQGPLMIVDGVATVEGNEIITDFAIATLDDSGLHMHELCFDHTVLMEKVN